MTCDERNDDDPREDYERATGHRYTIEPLDGMPKSYWRVVTVIAIVSVLLILAGLAMELIP